MSNSSDSPFKSHWIIGEPPRLENPPLVRIEHTQGMSECLEAVPCFLPLGEGAFLAGSIIGQQILPFALTSVPQGGIERGTPHPLVHVDDILLGDAKLAGNLPNLIGVQIVLVECRNFALRTAQTEERLLLARRRFPNFTSDRDRRIYPWIAARIHHTA